MLTTKFILIIKPRIIFPKHSYHNPLVCEKMMQKDMRTTEDQHLPPGYPAAEEVSGQPGQDKKKKPFETKQKGDRGFIEGCLFALCCCWICEMCF
ncbi:hypothetical protein N665_0029s0136 [Sinapis alba]|nr:hypothetical protein N665_0029s0136 [Sinapis alba]